MRRSSALGLSVFFAIVLVSNFIERRRYRVLLLIVFGAVIWGVAKLTVPPEEKLKAEEIDKKKKEEDIVEEIKARSRRASTQ